MTALALGEARAKAAAALAPATDADPEVIVNVVDAVSPPVLMLLWDDPWLEPDTFGPSLWTGRLEVLAVAGRVEIGAGIEKLEELVAFVIGRLRADDYPWPPATLEAPRRFPIGGVPYLGARVVYEIPISV